jgi:hypothetical protein
MTCQILGYLGALAVGFYVLRSAEKEKALVRTVGKTVAWIVLVVGLGGLLCSAWCGAKCDGPSAGCAWSMKCHPEGEAK